MTRHLAENARRVLAIELDASLARQPAQDFREKPGVEIIPADVLKVDLAALCRRAGTARALVFGNLPYYITSPLLHHLYAQRQSIRSMGLLMQREVAERLTARPGTRDYGYLTIATQMAAQPQIALAVPPGAFSPAPRVQSALVTFHMKAMFEAWPRQKREDFLEFVKRCFARKRKNLPNNLAGFYPRPRLLAALEAADQTPGARAEELSVAQLAALFELLSGSHAGPR